MKSEGAIAIRGAGRPSVGGRRTVGAAWRNEDEVALQTTRRAVRPLAAGAPVAQHGRQPKATATCSLARQRSESARQRNKPNTSSPSQRLAQQLVGHREHRKGGRSRSTLAFLLLPRFRSSGTLLFVAGVQIPPSNPLLNRTRSSRLRLLARAG